jgi:anthranilate 1,2-dioxygenase reductase subunit
MLDNIAEKGGCGHPIQLFYGVTQDNDLCETQRLADYRDRIADFDYHLVVSKPSVDWQGKTGWIPDHFDRQSFDANPFDIYLCGPPPMVDAIKTWFNDQKIEQFQMYYEKFIDSNSTH